MLGTGPAGPARCVPVVRSSAPTSGRAAPCRARTRCARSTAFAPDGTCVGTPDGPPSYARLEHHTLGERNGLALAWYDPEGAAPTWEVPDTGQNCPCLRTPTGPRRTRMLVATACADLRRPDAIGASLPRHGLHRAFARAMSKTAVGEVRKDLRIWNTRRYEPRPRLLANDEGIGLFRHWGRQFHP
ncbi:hypothetical protein [Streptomyces sp. NPDC093060]|uniref:hypothetical protein n=2 Tax=unclassified Streptomyces TaxID=2593676 RepID=UPI0037FAEE9B